MQAHPTEPQDRTFHGTFHRPLPALDAWTRLHVEPALEPDLAIIDPHHHLWDDERGRYLLEEFLAEIHSSGHRVVSSVYAQFKAMYRADGPDDMKPVGEVEFANGLAATCASGRHGAIRLCEGIIAHADLLHGDAVQPVLEALVTAGNGRLRGIRHGATWDDGVSARGRALPPKHLLRATQFRRGYARLKSLGLTFDAWLFYPQLDELVELLQSEPDTPVVLDHVGGVLGLAPHEDRDAVFRQWRESIRALARFPNLNVKLGGLGMLYLGWPFHFESRPPASAQVAAAWRPYIETCIDAFGPERCMFESNFPMDKQTCSYGVLWNAFKRITATFSAAEKSALYGGTAARVYRLRPPVPLTTT